MGSSPEQTFDDFIVRMHPARVRVNTSGELSEEATIRNLRIVRTEAVAGPIKA
jgi:hypothetical protein